MKIPLKWLTPMLLRLLSLSQVSFANAATAALQNAGSVHLVTGFHVGLAANPQPHDLSLDSTTYVQLSNQEFAIPIMPLHLLGKKSWNVYNQDNIAKVKHDEAIAAAKEAAEEERMQEIDSERRIQILRGERPTPLAIEDIPHTSDDPEHRDAPSREQGHIPRDRDRKKRKRPHEDDTDFELRIARDRDNAQATPSATAHPPSNAPLTDSTGHISLFASPTSVPTSATTRQQARPPPVAKNPDAELEAARERRAYEDQYTMRFANAAGFKQGLEAPWYSKPVTAAGSLPVNDVDNEPAVGGKGVRHSGSNNSAEKHNSNSNNNNNNNNNKKKDVWGAEDPARKRRAAAKMAGDDPLAAMKQGAAEVRRVERERKQWQEDRDREMLEVLLAQRERERERKDRRKRRRVNNDDDDDDGEEEEKKKYGVRRKGEVQQEEDELDGFLLDGHVSHDQSRHRRRSEGARKKEEQRRRSSHIHRERDTSREMERDRERESGRDRHRRHHGHRH